MHHLMSPPSAGLFWRAIGQSGTPLGNLNHRYRTAEEDETWGSKWIYFLTFNSFKLILRLMAFTGCSNFPLEALECLQAIDYLDILNMSPRFNARGAVDGLRSDNPILPDRPEVLMANGEFNQVNCLTKHIPSQVSTYFRCLSCWAQILVKQISLITAFSSCRHYW